MKRAEHQLTLPGVQEMSTQEERDEANEMIGFNRIPKIDMGIPVSVEEREALWSVEDAERQTLVDQNGNDGLVYDIGGDIYEVD